MERSRSTGALEETIVILAEVEQNSERLWGRWRRTEWTSMG